MLISPLLPPTGGFFSKDKDMQADMNDFIGWAISRNERWDGDLIELSCGEKDICCYTWLKTHKTWLEDIFPHTCSDDFEAVLDLTYRIGRYQQLPAGALAYYFKSKEAEFHHLCDDDGFWSEALEDFKGILDNDDFEEIIRGRIYLYLENTLREQVWEGFCQYQNFVRSLSWEH